MAYEIKIERAKNSRIGSVDFNNIPFGKIFSDHMFMADYYDGEWQDCRIIPFDNISLHPATAALHYGQEIFEGMKAYKNDANEPQLFRPERNAERMNLSAVRLAMPKIPKELFIKGLTELIALDSSWIPQKSESSLYIRPLMFAADEYVGVKPSDTFTFLIFTSPVQAYYTKPVKVLVADQFVRAFPGGVGSAKAAGNYAATMHPVELAQEKGYEQILWTDGVEFKYVQEIGTMNVFFIIDGKVVTPPVTEGIILDGITRDSVIQLLNHKGIPVEERPISVDELIEASEKGNLNDAFGTGTAATISYISDIGYKDMNMHLPSVETRDISNQVRKELEDIKVSRAPDIFNWVYKVEVEVPVDEGP